MIIIAHCERCDGEWMLRHRSPPERLQGICMECQADSDTEKPLDFRLADDWSYAVGMPKLPLGWLAE